MRTTYYEHADRDELYARVAQLAPRSVIVDIEPLVAYWDTDTAALDDGISRFLADISRIPSIDFIAFATNSTRRPTNSPEAPTAYHASAMKPFQLSPYAGLPKPGVVIGDQVATDGLLAWRLGFTFVRFRPVGRVKLGPWVMSGIGAVVARVGFRRR